MERTPLKMFSFSWLSASWETVGFTGTQEKDRCTFDVGVLSCSCCAVDTF
jgi:hypothetical protein